jgi:hypothetical protein
MQEKMRKKGELVAAVNGFNNTPPMNAVVALLDLYIELTRIQNDVAQESELKYNQGKIAAYRELKDVIVKGSPQIMIDAANIDKFHRNVTGESTY